MHFWEIPPQRPPSEAYSLLFRATRNCPWGRCEFCGNYRGPKFAIRSLQEVKQDIEAAKAAADSMLEWAERIGSADRIGLVARTNGMPWLVDGVVKHVFIGDADSPIMKTKDLVEILDFLHETFPKLERVTTYARAKTLLRKSPEDLKILRQAGLTRLHVGLESGDDDVLEYVHKGTTADEMIRSGLKVVEAGFELSEYVMPGLGGRERWRQHVRGTAMVLNRIHPHFIRLRTLNLGMVPGVPLSEKNRRGEFSTETLEGLVTEVRALIEALDVTSELIVSDFALNYYLLDIDGRLPEERERMLRTLDGALPMARQKDEDTAAARKRWDAEEG
ncbi:MAG: radical SAM protein [Deltaproteobacteria bacterium]|nr:radical SAM protein [Deltaproteobacteria bacterium]